MNRLKNEKSPYLLQHADNPVDWYPWCEEAFEKAVSEDKPVLLSIGYSTCHWCHVMEHESFEDEEVAALMNRHLISIKVDREERPDIDNIYMMVCQILSQGNCGWPLNIIMTPDKKPFFAATYLPRENRFGRIGMLELIPKLADVWKNKREEIVRSAEGVTEALMKVSDSMSGEEGDTPDINTLKKAFQQLHSRFDREHGGFGEAPKFPVPHNLIYLLRYHFRTGETTPLDMVRKTLDEMSKGGVYDHIGFGFHRYSTDGRWFLPHFEKMLYDQAMLAIAYTEAYQLTRDNEYRRIAEEILEYVLRDMRSPDGGFYSAEDADSEGEEGKFYLWSMTELIEILGEEDAGLISEIFNATNEGNYREEATGEKKGTNILHLSKRYDEIAAERGIATESLTERISSLRKRLFEVREKRVHPSKDDKILTDWNGLTIAALSKAARVFNNDSYMRAAVDAVDFINSSLTENSRLLHRYRNGDSGITANLDDYSFLVFGMIELYETTFDIKYLRQALKLNDDMIRYFWDDRSGGFYFTPSDGEDLIVRQKEIHDGASPSGSSVAMYNLIRLGRITANTQLEEKANTIARTFAASLNRVPISHTMHMVALDFAVGPAFEVVIAGDRNSEDTASLKKTVDETFIPNKVVIFRDTNAADKETDIIAPYTTSHKQVDGKAAAYVCRNYECGLPVTEPAEMLKLLK